MDLAVHLGGCLLGVTGLNTRRSFVRYTYQGRTYSTPNARLRNCGVS
jgi:hypothetical protein